MSIESDLLKDGIEVIGRLDTLSINKLSKRVAERLIKSFPRAYFNFNQLFIEFSRTPMYIAKMPEGYAEATYFYKNSSIYFKEGVPLDELEKFAVHELIHHIQEVKNQNGNLCRLGLCDYRDFKTRGLALNEGAVQLATAKALGHNQDIVKYYDISFPTTSPNYYPLLCNLVNQLAYITGEDLLFESTLFSTDQFKTELIQVCGKKFYLRIQDNLDEMLNIEDKIINLNNLLLNKDLSATKLQKVADKISNLKISLKNCFIHTQNLIFTSYFNNEFKKLSTTQGIEAYRFKLYNYKNYIGITDNYNTFNNYYLEKMVALEKRYEEIMNNVALVTIKESILSKLFKNILSRFSSSSQAQNY